VGFGDFSGWASRECGRSRNKSKKREREWEKRAKSAGITEAFAQIVKFTFLFFPFL